MGRTTLKWLAAALGAVGVAAFDALRQYVETSPLTFGNDAVDGIVAIAIATAIVRLGAWIVSKKSAE